MIRSLTEIPQLQQQSGTVNNATLAASSATSIYGSLATALLAANLAFTPIPKMQTASAIERAGTIGQFGNVFSRSYGQENRDFEESIAHFYSKLLADQEPLGHDFEQVLHANLWDLYVRS